MSQSISSLIKLKFLQSHSSDKNGDRKDKTNCSRSKDKNREDETYRRPFIQLAEIQEHTPNDEDKANLREFKPAKKHSKLSRIRHKMSRLDFRSSSERGSEDDENADAQHISNGQDFKEKHLISEHDTNSQGENPISRSHHLSISGLIT